MNSLFFRALLILFAVLITACASVYKPQNVPISTIDPGHGYRFTREKTADRGEHWVFLAFSGGGTRAAALSYGVLQELRDTPVTVRGKQIRLLDEVDSISSVSGGSFTAAYFGLFGDRLFSDYESAFLRQSIQGALIRKLFNPVYWWRSLFSGFDRTEMAVEYYDSQIFDGKTFADIPLETHPFIEINATDLGAGQRFGFTQGTFDLICSDLGSFPIARAVTASSAVPVAFPAVVLENHSDRCDTQRASRVRNLESRTTGASTRVKDLKQRLRSYSDAATRPYIHLIDGGITDNLGLRALIERMDAAGSDMFVRNQKRVPKDVLIIAVNAEVTPERAIEESAEKPSVIDTIDAFSNAQIALYNQETQALLTEKIGDIESELRQKGYEVRFYVAEVSFESLKEKNLKSYFNNLPTSLELSDKEIDLLIGTGRSLLRRSPQYRAFLTANHVGRQPP